MNYVKSKYLIPAVIVIIAILGIVGGYFYYKSQAQVKAVSTTPQQATQDEVKKIVAEVGKLIDLPLGEDPTIATVSDITKLKNQPFFQNAKNGDKVLIYTNARKAILYDPALNKVIDVAPINIGSQSAQVAQPRVALRNGTAKVGLTTIVETQLKKTIPALNVISKDNTSNPDIEKTIIVIFNDQ